MFGMSLQSLLTCIIIGGIAGWVASKIMGSKGGLIRNIIIGVLGGFLGTVIVGSFGFTATKTLGTIISSIVGSCALIFIGKILFK
jgi:uncharacterized membrane protein YeaQ/YmgE (transglycosylase-associated protein family)